MFNRKQVGKNTRIVLPTAPNRPYGIDEKYYSWFDVYQLGSYDYNQGMDALWKHFNQEDLVKSADNMLDLIEQERLKLPY